MCTNRVHMEREKEREGWCILLLGVKSQDKVFAREFTSADFLGTMDKGKTWGAEELGYKKHRVPRHFIPLVLIVNKTGRK